MSFCVNTKSKLNNILKESLWGSRMFTLTEAVFVLFLARWNPVQ